VIISNVLLRDVFSNEPTYYENQLLMADIFFLISYSSVIKLYGQEAFAQKIQSYFDTYQKEYPVEKSLPPSGEKHLHVGKKRSGLAPYLTEAVIRFPPR